MIDKIIFNYKINSVLGEGGMSTVYLAEHEKLGTKAAIKVLDSKLAKRDDIRERFKNEAKLLASLKHPNIVSLLNYDEDEDRFVIIMDYAEGRPIDQYVREENLSHDQIKNLFIPILDAFQFAHDKGVVHRDIKPNNLIVSNDGTPYVLDFGIAKILELDLTQYTQQLGTPTYMSPEQVKDSKELDHRSDIYSLGVTLYQLLTGSNPFKGEGTSAFEVMNKIVNDPMPLLGNEFDAVLQKAAAKNPTERYSSCKEFINGIKNGESSTQTVVSPENEKTIVSSDESTIVSSPTNDDTIVAEASNDQTIVAETPGDKKVADKAISQTKGKAQKKPTTGGGINKKTLIIGGSALVIIVVTLIFVFTGSSRLFSADEYNSFEYELGNLSVEFDLHNSFTPDRNNPRDFYSAKYGSSIMISMDYWDKDIHEAYDKCKYGLLKSEEVWIKDNKFVIKGGEFEVPREIADFDGERTYLNTYGYSKYGKLIVINFWYQPDYFEESMEMFDKIVRVTSIDRINEVGDEEDESLDLEATETGDEEFDPINTESSRDEEEGPVENEDYDIGSMKINPGTILKLPIPRGFKNVGSPGDMTYESSELEGYFELEIAQSSEFYESYREYSDVTISKWVDKLEGKKFEVGGENTRGAKRYTIGKAVNGSIVILSYTYFPDEEDEFLSIINYMSDNMDFDF